VRGVVEAHLVLDELTDLLDRVGVFFPLEAGVDVLGVLPEGRHVHSSGAFTGEGEPTDAGTE